MLSIITRCYKRPKSLKRCIESVKMQTDSDFEHLMIIDEKGHGLHWANRQIASCKDKCNGHYIYVLDDDDFLLCDNFIEEFKALVTILNRLPDVIICKGYIAADLFPTVWKNTPQRKQIAAPNFIVKNEIFTNHAHQWNQPCAGDFYFIDTVLKSGATVFWWDKVAFQANPSKGLTETQKIKYGMDL